MRARGDITLYSGRMEFDSRQGKEIFVSNIIINECPLSQHCFNII
jgi:hypothetical protein